LGLPRWTGDAVQLNRCVATLKAEKCINIDPVRGVVKCDPWIAKRKEHEYLRRCHLSAFPLQEHLSTYFETIEMDDVPAKVRLHLSLQTSSHRWTFERRSGII
jgi:hypothetical protein